MVWLWRALASVAAITVLFGISVAAASGPIDQRGVPASSGASGEPEPLSAMEELYASEGPEGIPAPESVPTGPVPMEERPTAVFVGDSISRGMTEPSSGVVGEYSWFYGLVDDTTGVLRHVATIAENGMSTSWMAGQAWSAVAYRPDLLIVHGGTNDVSGEVDPASVIANLQTIHAAAEYAGIRMAVCTLPPRSDPAADARVLAVNDAIRAWADGAGVIVLDTGTPLRAEWGGWLPGMTTDGLHPTPEAARIMSEAAVEGLRGIPLGV